MYFTKHTTLYLDGKFFPANEISINFYGQTFQYGFGAFEGIRAYQTEDGTRIFKAREHYERLKNSCTGVHIPFPFEVEALIEVTYALLKKNGLTDAYIRPVVYCGANMGLNVSEESHILIAVWQPTKPKREDLIRLCTSGYQRPNPKSLKLDAKITGHYVNSILAKTEAMHKGYDDSVMLDMHGNVAEAPGANIFYEKDGELITPSCGHIFSGITRQTVIGICKRLQIPVSEQVIHPDMLREADAMFLCGTAAEVTGAGSIDDNPFSKPWRDTICATIQREYNRMVLASASEE